MDLSIVVINWNTRDLLADCLRSVYRHPPVGEWELIVVDNASDDDSAAMVREQFPQVRLVANRENIGFGPANNQAIRLSQGRYILLLNSDAQLIEPGSLPALTGWLDKRPEIGALAPRLINPDGSFQASYAAFPTFLSEFLLITRLARLLIGPYAPSPRPRTGETARPVDWVAGAAFLIRKEAVDDVGLFDESFFFYSEETEWCWRFWQGGWQIWYIPEVAVVHHAGASSRQRSAVSYSWLYLSKVRFFARAYGSRSAAVLRLTFMTIASLRFVLWLALFLLLSFSASRRQQFGRRLQQERALLSELSRLAI